MVRKRTIASAPTRLNARARLLPITSVTTAISTLSSTSVAWNPDHGPGRARRRPDDRGPPVAEQAGRAQEPLADARPEPGPRAVGVEQAGQVGQRQHLAALAHPVALARLALQVGPLIRAVSAHAVLAAP